MKKALIVIDYQNDFVAEYGILTAGKPAREIKTQIIELMEQFEKNNHHIIFTLDTHERDNWDNHPESAAFPIHCEKGTQGHNIFELLENISDYTNIFFMEKSSYVLKNADIETIVNEYDEIEVCGVVTDICVVQNVIAIYNFAANIGKQIKIIVNKKACASFDLEMHKKSLQYMKEKLGVNVL